MNVCFSRDLMRFYYTSMYNLIFFWITVINRHHFPDYHIVLVGCTIKDYEEITSKNQNMNFCFSRFLMQCYYTSMYNIVFFWVIFINRNFSDYRYCFSRVYNKKNTEEITAKIQNMNFAFQGF